MASQKWIASIPASSSSEVLGRISLFGGTLELNDEALEFNTIGSLGPSWRIRLSEVIEVEAWGDRPPRLRLTVAGFRAKKALIVLSRRRTPVWTDETSPRDECVKAIAKALKEWTPPAQVR